jgi:hypothetical protein
VPSRSYLYSRQASKNCSSSILRKLGKNTILPASSATRPPTPVRAAHAEQNISNLLAELDSRKPKRASESGKVKYLEIAVRNLFKRTRHPLSELSRELNEKARRARFVLWWVETEKRFAPGLYCDDIATALATALFSRVVSPQAVAICERCGNQFIRTKRPQRFCSLRCGNADRKARQRDQARQRKSRQKRG